MKTSYRLTWLDKIKKYSRCSDKVFNSENSSYHCAHCGKIFNGKDVIYTLDHYLPNSMNGMTNADNLFPVCQDCNQERGDTLIDGREYYRYLTTKAYQEMLISISHTKVLQLLQKNKK